jgi:hypothetical protein
MNYTSIDAVFSRLSIPFDQVDEGDIIEWAMQGLDLMNIKRAYQQEMAVLTVTNHKTKLPVGLVQIEIVATPELGKLPSEEEIQELETCDIDYINKQHVDRIQEYGIINNYNLFVRTQYFKSNFFILKLANRPLMGNFHCDDCPNLHSNCALEYSIDTMGCVTTSFASGDLCIGYLKHATDKNGKFLIPDEENLILALVNWVTFKFWEQRSNMHEEGAERREEKYLRRAQNLMAKARGIFITREFNYQNYVDIVYKNIKWANSYTIFNNQNQRGWTRIK